ncbi:MAG: helix-turn-helix transcriptional regulator [Eggerthellaceae bacterium]|nr:helix-turn-helix transcriptional regulator [Eggerthellaceae bacterium]
MKDLAEDMYRDAFRSWQFEPSMSFDKYGGAGSLYTFDNETGHGEYWVHFNKNLFAVNRYEMHFDKPGTMRYQHGEHLSICLYESVKGVFAEGYCAQPGAVSVYVAQEGQEYVGRFMEGAELKATSITISPDYYRDYLQQRFGAIPDVREAFAKVDGRKDFPELMMLFKSIQDYRGDGLAAELFYEGVVAEAIGLVIKRAADIEAASDVAPLSKADASALVALESYLWNHLDQEITVGQMAQVTCMGLTKFKAAFKSQYGCTPASYMQGMRVAKAKELIEQTDEPIAVVAGAVGYRKASTFGEMFKRKTGVLPSTYRKRVRSERS